MKKKNKYFISAALGIIAFLAFGIFFPPQFDGRSIPMFCLRPHAEQVNKALDIVEAEIQTSKFDNGVCLYDMKIHKWFIKSGQRTQSTLMIMEDELPKVNIITKSMCKPVGNIYIVLLGAVNKRKYAVCINSYVVEPSEEEEMRGLIAKGSSNGE